ncbi:transcriptional regulator NrdR [Candidatus Absconditicoccus praedator]|uniref:transcriptional regulator NrdR n=1 Tax=Candidatus Absconditicoccus praedator TaxID=2735562 RepID=UPI001E5BBD3E|nr:transcriptional regulator NrdR [Candidatus Absconditicoccus praedator]UFX83025.1 transcriptional repressor NrdR [Candidatus Absconditicoccus praedator]
MKCPKCGNMETRVVDSRIVEDGRSVRRRRNCEYCGKKFTTFEKTGITDLLVIKRNGNKEIYDRMKIKKALMLAFAKRDFSVDQIEEIISQLEVNWLSKGKEVDSIEIGDDILNLLKEIDMVAYIRFASVYKKFENLEDFKKIIENKGGY